jgi:hypothetical protein
VFYTNRDVDCASRWGVAWAFSPVWERVLKRACHTGELQPVPLSRLEFYSPAKVIARILANDRRRTARVAVRRADGDMIFRVPHPFPLETVRGTA